MSDDYKFTLRANGYHLNIRTIDVGVPVAGSNPPGPNEVDIEGTILNPNMVGFVMPTKVGTDPLWAVSPASLININDDAPPTYDGVPPTVVNWIWANGRGVIINVGAGVYSTIVSKEYTSSTLTPTDIISDIDIPGTLPYQLISSTQGVSEDGSATYSGVSVVEWKDCSTFPPTDEWYRPPEDGWYLLKTNVDSALAGLAGNSGSLTNDWWWETVPSQYGSFFRPGGVFCRYNPDTDPVLDTFDDPIWNGPEAAFDCAIALDTSHPLGPPTDVRWYWCKFFKGGPSDFPVGQRLRTTTKTLYANGRPTSFAAADDEPMPLNGEIGIAGIGGETTVPIPYPAVPWPYGTNPGQTKGDVRDTDLFKVTFKIRLRKL